jgi:rhodanese-related sulfurtransferase
VRTISRHELVGRIASGSVIVVNVLAKDAYERLHIKGSISIPRGELERGGWERLDKGRQVVVHCSSYSCGASRMAAEFLESKGFDAWAYEGGIKDWAEADLPTEGLLTNREFLAQRYPTEPRAAS